MRVVTDHRRRDTTLTLRDFEVAADGLVTGFAGLRGTTAIVVCGSLAKHDVVPGWSDIDLLVFTNNDALDLHFLRSASEVLASPLCQRIGVGVDFCELSTFRRFRKIGGRPYMMTLEVGAYGERRWGIDPWKDLVFDDRWHGLIEFERPLLLAAEIHNWRRDVAAADFDNVNTPRNLCFLSAKALLRLLQIETGPNLAAPITAVGSYERLRARNPRHPALDGFSEALALRSIPRVDYSVAEWTDLLRKLADALTRYPVVFLED